MTQGITPRTFRPILLLLWVLFGALSLGFAWTDGLAYSDPSIPAISHVSGLQSSGGDDDLCVEAGVVIAAAALLWGALRVRGRFARVDVAVHAALIAMQLLCLLGIEAGSIQETIVRDRNWVLAAWFATLAALVCCAFLTRAPEARRLAETSRHVG